MIESKLVQSITGATADGVRRDRRLELEPNRMCGVESWKVVTAWLLCGGREVVGEVGGRWGRPPTHLGSHLHLRAIPAQPTSSIFFFFLLQKLVA